MGLRLEYQHDLNDLERIFGRLSRLNFAKADDEIGGYMVSEIVGRFEEQKTWEGDDFVRSQTAIERKGQTLIEHGHLRDSYTWQVTTRGLAIGSDLDYAAIHHFGGQAGRGLKSTITSNPVLGVNEQDADEIGAILMAHVQEQLGAQQ